MLISVMKDKLTNYFFQDHYIEWLNCISQSEHVYLKHMQLLFE